LKTIAILLLTLFSLALYAQDFDSQSSETPYDLPAPEGWGTERFPIPIVFAPEIEYSGEEDIRFAPGWAKAKSEEYWSYAFLWYLDGKVKTNPEIVAGNMKTYYEGLIGSNGAHIPKENLIPVVTTFRKVKKEEGDRGTFTGTVKMTNYMNQEPVTLNCKVHLKSCGDKTIIFYELSPKLFEHAVWAQLDLLWTGFRCTKD
jgi:hypothetical protein